MVKATFLLAVLVFVATTSSVLEAQVTKQCEYEMVLNTGATRGPTYKLWVIIEAIGGDNINTTNVVKKWGDMGRGHTYFLPNSTDRFRTKGPCLPDNFCNILIGGGKKRVELNPHWFINNITVATKGDKGFNRLKTFRFLSSGNEVDFTNPALSEGECP